MVCVVKVICGQEAMNSSKTFLARLQINGYMSGNNPSLIQTEKAKDFDNSPSRYESDANLMEYCRNKIVCQVNKGHFIQIQ